MSKLPGVVKIFIYKDTSNKYLTMIHPFFKTQLIYEISIFIKDHRDQLLRDLVAYTKDPVRYKRRIRMLIQLADYERQTLEKIFNFETHNMTDLDKNNMLALLHREVKIITDISS
jgi:hypothetical protein